MLTSCGWCWPGVGTDEGEDVVNVEFSLGYGGKILLHQARLWLKRGHRYGIVGKVSQQHSHKACLVRVGCNSVVPD